MSIAVPGEVAGFWKAHQLYGKLPWSSLFEPTIKLARNGFRVAQSLAKAVDEKINIIRSDPELR